MSCMIHVYAEKQDLNGEYKYVPNLDVFSWQDYGFYGFLANVRNYSAIPYISLPRGFPSLLSKKIEKEWNNGYYHNCSWLGIAEMLAFNYDVAIEDRRYTKKVDGGYYGGATSEVGKGKKTTFREFLGKRYFEDLQLCKDKGITRIIFWFDS